MIPIEFKDQVARKYGYADWQDCYNLGNPVYITVILEEAGLLYAQSKWDEACEDQRTACAIACNTQTDGTYYFKSICAPKPEFKP